jgi:hypothetical protein
MASLILLKYIYSIRTVNIRTIFRLAQLSWTTQRAPRKRAEQARLNTSFTFKGLE